MIEFENGIITISKWLKIYPGYTFTDFMKTNFYEGQDPKRIIYLDGTQFIDGRNYLINLFFQNNKIYIVSLICSDKYFEAKNEKQRKEFHDHILKEYNIVSPKSYYWGNVSSCYDLRGNISSINIMYSV